MAKATKTLSSSKCECNSGKRLTILLKTTNPMAASKWAITNSATGQKKKRNLSLDVEKLHLKMKRLVKENKRTPNPTNIYKVLVLLANTKGSGLATLATFNVDHAKRTFFGDSLAPSATTRL